MPLNNKCVFPSVVIKIFQSDSPARNVSREDAKTCFQFLRAEQSLAVIMKNNVRIVWKLSDKKVGKAIVVIILKNYAHARGHPPGFRKRSTRIQSAFGECTVAVIVKKKLIDGVVGDKNVRKTIAVVVRECNAEAMALLRGDAGSDADILKCTVPPIAVEDACNPGKRTRRAVRRSLRAARFAFLDAPIEIAGKKKIQPAVVIVIEKSRRDRPTAGGNASLGGDVGKSAVAIVVIQNIFSEVSHIDVRKPVIVVIAAGDSHAVV